MNQTTTQQLIDFIIDQKLELENYWTLEEPLRNAFKITKEGPRDATTDLLSDVITWEALGGNSSLESLLQSKYNIIKK